MKSVIVGIALLATTMGVLSTNGAVLSVQQRADSVRTPGAGSATRTALLDAIRKHFDVRSRFKVGHARVTDRWAFVRCVEVVDDDGSLQETDLDVAALLERRTTGGTARWHVVEVWAVSTDDTRPYAAFARRVRERARAQGIPTALFPDGFLTSDVPVE